MMILIRWWTSELSKNMKNLIQSSFQNIMQDYNNQLEKLNSTGTMLQEHVTNLKYKNSNLWEKAEDDRQ